MVTINDILKNKEKEVQNLKKVSYKRNKSIYTLKNFLIQKPFICEIKKSSPSKGIINNSINVTLQAVKYENSGAGAISVLTDKQFFSGNIKDLYEISQKLKLPILCKDFIISEIQIENAFLAGADIILLIVNILNDYILKKLVNFAKNLGISILFELHEFDDLKKIEKFNPEYVGVNSRNLRTMKIEKKRAFETLKKLSNLNAKFIKIAESGITTKDDIKFFRQAGADAFLIGTTLMKTQNISKVIKEFSQCL